MVETIEGYHFNIHFRAVEMLPIQSTGHFCSVYQKLVIAFFGFLFAFGFYFVVVVVVVVVVVCMFVFVQFIHSFLIVLKCCLISV